MESSLTEKVLNFLQDHPGEKFTSRELAENLIKIYPDYYLGKKERSKLDESGLIAQLSAEISAKKNFDKFGITWDTNPRPQHYYLKSENENIIDNSHNETIHISQSSQKNSKECDLYSPLIQYLSSELNLDAMRINEKTSKNSRGEGLNRWIHPDIVAMQILDKDWIQEVKDCCGENINSRIKLFSFEVKKDLTNSNFKEYFFQAVSNSSWANEGYLVATSLPKGIEDDLRMLSELHGIGLIIIDINRIEDGEIDISNSEIVIPAKPRHEVDWQSVNRLAEENSDFRKFLKEVKSYIKSGVYHPLSKV